MSARDWVADVRAFHERNSQLVNECPTWPGADVMELRFGLILEEVAELMKAVEDGDMVEVADAIADTIYVLIGTAVSMGIPLHEVWVEVQRSNMAKVEGGGRRNAAGKVIKPEGWTPPQLDAMFEGVEPPTLAVKQVGASVRTHLGWMVLERPPERAESSDTLTASRELTPLEAHIECLLVLTRLRPGARRKVIDSLHTLAISHRSVLERPSDKLEDG